MAHACALLACQGFKLKEIWSENRWAVDLLGLHRLTAFVLSTAQGLELDIHAIGLDKQGNGLPEWVTEAGFIFTRHDLNGKGLINGLPVRCIAPEKQRLCHMGYELPEKHIPDLLQLKMIFGVGLPDGLSRLIALGKSG